MLKTIQFYLFRILIISVSLFGFSSVEAKYENTSEYKQANQIIENILNKHFTGFDAEAKKLSFLKNLNSKLNEINIENRIISIYKESITNNIVKIELQLQNVQKVLVGYSEEFREIYAYYKGDINEDFFLILANSHGSYEYGTYHSAMDLIDYFESTGKTQWFIIPTLNPDGLQIAIDDNFNQGYYLEGRSNSNNIDLNRNFCTKNFKSGEYLKYFGGESTLIGRGEYCGDQQETKVIDTIFTYFSFSHVIDIHSLGGIIFIPDNGFEDSRVINFADKVQEILGYKYEFNSNYSTTHGKNILIERYEFDEGGTDVYTGILAQYIYEQYNIPAIIVELEYHGRIEENLRKLEEFLK